MDAFNSSQGRIRLWCRCYLRLTEMESPPSEWIGQRLVCADHGLQPILCVEASLRGGLRIEPAA